MKEPETPSPEDLEKFQALMRRMVPVPSGHLIGNLRHDHQTLAGWLREFEPTSAIRLIASLDAKFGRKQYKDRSPSELGLAVLQR